VTTTDVGLMPLVLQLGRARAAMMDVPAVLLSVCSALPSALGVAGALLLLVEPPVGVRPLSASDARAQWFGEAQQRAGVGPLQGAVRTWRPTLTGDLTRIGHPSVAAAANESGLSSSLVLPFDVDGDRLGVLQLLGDASRPVAAGHAEILRPLLDALAARLADVRALHLARGRTEAAATPTAAAVPVPRSADGVARPRERDPSGASPKRSGRRSVESTGSSPSRRARGGRGTHSASDDASAPESTTRALPAVRRESAPVPADAERGRSTTARRRTGRHSA
jgi:hypothetical protein